MAVQIEKHEALASTQQQLISEGFHPVEHQHNGFIYEKQLDGWEYKAVMDMNGQIKRYKPTKMRRPVRRSKSRLTDGF